MSDGPAPWDEARVAALRAHWDAGLSVAEIGGRLGLTKNAVVGKAHRLGLAPRPSPIRRGIVAATSPGARSRRPGGAAAVEAAHIRAGASVTIAALLVPPPAATSVPAPDPAPAMMRPVARPRMHEPCCWPLGTPRTPGFRFCGADAPPPPPHRPASSARPSLEPSIVSFALAAPAAAAPALAAPDGAPASVPASPLPRRLSATKLLNAVLKAPRFADDVLHQAVVPYGAERVLRAVCAMIAGTEDGEVWTPSRFAGGRVAAVLALKIGRIGAEDQVASDLAALTRVGMVIAREDGALTLPLDFEALRRPRGARGGDSGEAGAEKDRGGRPRKGETAEARAERLARERHAQRSLPGMVSVVEGGRGAAGSGIGVVAGGDGETSAETGPQTSGQTGAETGRVSLRGVSGFGPETLAETLGGDAKLAAEEQIDDSIGFQQQQEDARAGAETPETQNLGGFPETSVRKPPETETPGGFAGAVTPAVADALVALRIGGILELVASRGSHGPELVAEWRALGLGDDDMVRIAEARKAGNAARIARGDRVNPPGSFDFLDAAMREAAGAPSKRASQAGPVAEVVLPEGMAESWMTPADRAMLSGALLTVDRGEAAAIARTMSRLEASFPRLLKVLLRAHPALEAVVGRARRRMG